MKSINVYFEDEDYKRLEKEKGSLTWRDFILKLIKLKGGKENERRNIKNKEV